MKRRYGFLNFHNRLKSIGLIANKGKSVDATIVEVPIQRNTKAENEKIKSGKEIAEWNEEGKEAKKRQKDIDARWTKKRGRSSYGYKDHIKIDNKSKLIDTYEVSTASEEDAGQTLYGDSAYRSKKQEACIKEKGMKSRIHQKGYRDNPLNELQQKSNKSRSRIRGSIGMDRAKAQIGLKNLAYNIKRSTFLVSKQKVLKTI